MDMGRIQQHNWIVNLLSEAMALGFAVEKKQAAYPVERSVHK